MASIELRGDKKIGDFQKPYIVAELNTSHFGDIDIAKKMIDSAKEAGCDCVKFQSWSTDTLYSKSYYIENPIAKRFVSKFSLSEPELVDLSNYCEKVNIDFCSTPYSKKEVDFLVNNGAPYIKVASMDLNNYHYLRYIALTGLPVVLSTGMGSIEEIEKAVGVFESEKNYNLCILHCVSIYPPDLRTIRLKNIIGLRDKFPNYPIGYSDHSQGVEIATAAVALGSCMIEKHFTLDKSRIGMDNQMALEPNEMKCLVENCHNVHASLGSYKRVISSAEYEQRTIMRRSIVTKKNLKAGTKLEYDDLDTKRPGTGLPPDMIDSLVGKTLTKDIDSDMLIREDDLLLEK